MVKVATITINFVQLAHVRGLQILSNTSFILNNDEMTMQILHTDSHQVMHHVVFGNILL